MTTWPLKPFTPWARRSCKARAPAAARLFPKRNAGRFSRQPPGYYGLDAKTLDSLISRSKQEVLYPADLSPDISWLPAYQAYEDALTAKAFWDFDDLVARAVRLLRRQPQVLTACQQHYAAILVDEYQDLNQSQYELLRLLAPADHQNLFVIGDPNQAIYGFRGAQPKYFNRFTQDWPTAQTISLAETYRLPSPILALARKTLGKATQSSVVPLSSVNTSDLPPVLLKAANAQAEAEQIAGLIDYLVGGGSHLSLEDDRLRYADPAGPGELQRHCRPLPLSRPGAGSPETSSGRRHPLPTGPGSRRSGVYRHRSAG